MVAHYYDQPSSPSLHPFQFETTFTGDGLPELYRVFHCSLTSVLHTDITASLPPLEIPRLTLLRIPSVLNLLLFCLSLCSMLLLLKLSSLPAAWPKSHLLLHFVFTSGLLLYCIQAPCPHFRVHPPQPVSASLCREYHSQVALSVLTGCVLCSLTFLPEMALCHILHSGNESDG